MFKIGIGVKPFKKNHVTKKNLLNLIQAMDEGQTIRIQKLLPQRTCIVPNRGVPCGKKFTPEKKSQKYCSPWCNNRASTQAARAK